MGDLAKELAYHAVACAVVSGAAGITAMALWLGVLQKRGRLLPLPRLRPVYWIGTHVLFAFFLMVFVPPLVQRGLEGRAVLELIYGHEVSELRRQLWASVISCLLIVPTILLVLYFASGIRPAHVGLARTRLAHNVALGCLAWFPLTLLTLAIFFLTLTVMSFFDMEPESHPLIALARTDLLGWEWILIAVATLVAAPVLEELVFRGVLQGWLLRCSIAGHMAVLMTSLVLAALLYLSPLPDNQPDSNLLVFAGCLAPGYLVAMYRSHVAASLSFQPRRAELSDASASVRAGLPPISSSEAITVRPALEIVIRAARPYPFAAIYGTSMLWAVFHGSAWPSPIPLFVLGLGLGWLAYRTQSLVSPIVVHVLFNAVALIVLVMEVELR